MDEGALARPVLWAAATIAMFSGLVVCANKPSVPARLALADNLRLIDLWSRAPFVVTGSIARVRRIGAPRLGKNGNSESITVYPCEAEFLPSIVIKGQAQDANRKLLWFSYFPSCAFGHRPEETIGQVDRIWFLRVDGKWLRPVADNAAPFLGLFQRFSPDHDDSESLRRALVGQLLTPEAVAKTNRAFVERFDDLFGVACEITTEEICFQILTDRYNESAPDVRAEICRFLAGSFDQCPFSDCPRGILYPGLTDHRAEDFQAQRRNNELRDASEERIKELLNSGKLADREWTRRRLWILSCNFDPLIRRRAGELLRRFFPGAEIPTCVNCR
jgi:hypothetical protein